VRPRRALHALGFALVGVTMLSGIALTVRPAAPGPAPTSTPVVTPTDQVAPAPALVAPTAPDEPGPDPLAWEAMVRLAASRVVVAKPPAQLAKPEPKPFRGGWPVTSRSAYVSQPFGCTGLPLEPAYGSCSHFHTGIDIVAAPGTTIIAAVAGTVVLAGSPGDCGGRQVVIRNSRGRYFLYAHLSSILTRTGRRVAAGTVIGRLGSTGCTTGPHLHFQVSIGRPWDGGSRFVNPWRYIDRGPWLPARYR
jgi:murein DD-endopeptidase MepM/ murein hydrolase activator NlpD